MATAPLGGLGEMANPNDNPGVRTPGMYTPEAMKAGDIKQDPDDPKQKDDLNARAQAFITEKWQDLRTAYTVFHQMCWQDILFYANMLWIKWDNSRRIWGSATPEDEWTPQPLVNYFAPAADSVASIFKIPEVEAAPKVENNMLAHEVAEIANVLADHFRTENGLINMQEGQESKGHTAAQFFVLCGNVLTCVRRIKSGYASKPLTETTPMADMVCQKCGWQNRLPAQEAIGLGGVCPQCQGPLNDPSVVQVTKQKTDPVSGKPMVEQVANWKVTCDIVNPMQWLPRAGSRNFQGQRYGIHAERMSIDEIKELYQFDATPDNQFLDSMESSWEIALNYYYTGYSSLTSATKDSALILRMYVEPGKVTQIPEGGVIVYCNEKVVTVEPWADECPVGHQLTHGGYLKMPTTYFYRTSMFETAGVQVELNRYEALMALHGMTSASDSLVIDDNTSVTGVTGRGDVIIHFRSIGPGSVPPHRLQHGSLDDGIYQKHQQLRDQIQNISATVNVWRGQQAGSVTAAAAISQLRGQAEQMFSDPSDNWQKMWVETTRKGVKLYQLVLEPWQIAEIMGEGHDVQIAKFKMANLDTLLNWIPTTHGLPRTRDEKRNDMLALFDRGALEINDPGVKIRISELFGETGMEQMFNRDATRARAENDNMKKGVKPTFMPEFEDLQTHLFIHTEHIKRLDFDKYPDSVKQMMMMHAMETKMALAGLMQMQAADGGTGATEGAAGGAGAPGGEGERGGAPGGGPKPGEGGPGKRPAKRQPGPKKQSAAGRPGATNQITTPTGPGGPQ